MTRVYVVVEGATEESFVKGPLAGALWPRNVLLIPIILGVAGHRGGRASYARMRKDLLKQLKQDSEAYCSTMIDFYGLGPGFPGGPLDGLPPIRQVEKIEQGIKYDICGLIPKHRPDERLIPYLSLHEFESLLFSDPEAFARALSQPSLAPRLSAVRSEFSTPEDINDGPNTAPSKRIAKIYPAYQKVIEGTLAARAVGIEAIRRECPHFRRWFEQLQELGRTWS